MIFWRDCHLLFCQENVGFADDFQELGCKSVKCFSSVPLDCAVFKDAVDRTCACDCSVNIKSLGSNH